MARIRNLPDSASVALPADGVRLHAPSAERNGPAIARVLLQHAPKTGRALEIASGTGQHVAQFARALPGLIWQPTEIDAGRRQSIDAYSAGCPPIRPALHLDATQEGWSDAHGGQDVIIMVNLVHLISHDEARIAVSEASRALAPGGLFFLYGPFLRKGQTSSEGDAQFHASLRAADPDIGYKDVAEIRQWLEESGLQINAIIDMPANNLIVIGECPKERV